MCSEFGLCSDMKSMGKPGVGLPFVVKAYDLSRRGSCAESPRQGRAMRFVTEPETQIPVAHEVDVCVVGGSCTGVFAAIRAARMGQRVVLVEKRTLLGGMATAAQVTQWHSTYDSTFTQKIIGGLQDEVLDCLRRRNALAERAPGERIQYSFNPALMACELERLLIESGVHLCLETTCVRAFTDAGRISAIAVEDVAGRRAIAASMFVDCSGDGVLLRRAGFKAVQHDELQPVSYQTMVSGIQTLCDTHPGCDLWGDIRDLIEKYDFPHSNPWIDPIPGAHDVHNVFGARLNGVDASDPAQLTGAYVEGRRLALAYLDILKERFPKGTEHLSLTGVAPALGVRETWHACCLHQLTGDELMSGAEFDDSIGNGTYPVDIHGPEGTILRYLDGRESWRPSGGEQEWRQWRDPAVPTPKAYRIPLRALIPQSAKNLLVAGRLMDSDRDAYGALRVMVNTNQTGEAAGVAAALCISEGCDVADAPADKVRDVLQEGGSILV